MGLLGVTADCAVAERLSANNWRLPTSLWHSANKPPELIAVGIKPTGVMARANRAHTKNKRQEERKREYKPISNLCARFHYIPGVRPISGNNYTSHPVIARRLGAIRPKGSGLSAGRS